MLRIANKTLLLVLVLVIIISGLPLSITSIAESSTALSAVENGSAADLFDYYNEYQSAEKPQESVTINATDIVSCENIKKAVDTIDGVPAVHLDENQGWCEWSFNIAQSGRYNIYLDYYPLDGNGKDIGLDIKIDGNAPFKELEYATLPRLWQDGEYDNDGTFIRDKEGNDVRPQQVEVKTWQSTSIYDVQGLYSEPYFVYLESGVHTLRLTVNQEAVAVSKISFGNEVAAVSYKEYISEYDSSDYFSGENIIIQAEYAYRKNSSLLYPTYDSNDAFTQPADPTVVRLNTIGQSNWAANGDEISWKVNVKTAGLYKLAFRAKQNYNKGMISYRMLKINGEVPFSEAKAIPFEYDDGWYMSTLGKETPYLIYLEPGDVISLTCTTADVSRILRDIQHALLDLNKIYRSIISITSTDPDIYRDYSLEKQIPNLEEDLSNSAEFIDSIADSFFKITGTRGSEAAVLDYVSKIIKQLLEAPYTIPERLDTFKSAIESVGSLVLILGNQPLELDYFVLVSPENEIPKAKGSWFNAVGFFVKQFLSSFSDDYSSGEDSEDMVDIDVWVSTGRDQFKIINNLINDGFAQSNINVTLSMVDTGATLIKASLAGKGPDVALMMPMDTPMNLAARGALVAFDENELSSLLAEFDPQSLQPFYYDGSLYAIPETLTFDMLFYRTDVFAEYGLEAPKTWDDFYHIIEILHKNNLAVGVQEIDAANMGVSLGIQTFNRFLLQSGGTYYNEDLSEARFNTQEAYDAFEKWVKLHTEYGLERQFDFYSRFRSGELAMSIQGYSAYNQLMAAAPEIRGLWSMVPVPGTLKDDGTVDRSESCSVTGSIMLKRAVERGVKNQAIEFIKWWASADTQILYGQQLEATMGIAARYTPANIKVLNKMGWSYEELAVLSEQLDSIVGIPVVPGNYVVSRSITSAFRAAYGGQYRPQRAIAIYNDIINDEIARKRKEFNLE